MADARLRAAERHAPDSPEALRQRMRAGLLDPERVRLAAALGHAGAREAAGPCHACGGFGRVSCGSSECYCLPCSQCDLRAAWKVGGELAYPDPRSYKRWLERCRGERWNAGPPRSKHREAVWERQRLALARRLLGLGTGVVTPSRDSAGSYHTEERARGLREEGS